MATSQAPDYTGTENLEVMADAVNYNRFLRHLVRRWLPEQKRPQVADFGAGIGTFSDIFTPAEADVRCMEIDTDLRGRLESKGFQLDELNVTSQDYDFVYSLNVLEHIADDQGALNQLVHRLKPGGKLMIYVPAFNILWTPMDTLLEHHRRYRRAELQHKLTQAGLSVIKCEYADSAGYFATLLFKLLPGQSGTINRTALILFDRIAFPLGRVLDSLGLKYVLGKNVFAVAVKAQG
jgi:SAM-dependent methyltransferase